MSFIEVKDLTKQYMMNARPILALRGLNLDVQENEICTIMGPSGCGKSTLLNILGGIDEPTSGFARVGNFAMVSDNRMPWSRGSSNEIIQFRRHSIGFIFQFHNLSPVFTALENVELPMIFAGVQRQVRKKRAQELLEEVGLGPRLHHKPDELSGGERQRVAVAIAFANNPPVILADEPTGELDQENSEMICNLFLKLKEIKNFSMILVTHNPAVAKIGHNIYNMKDGAIKGVVPKSVITSMADMSMVNSLQDPQVPVANNFPPRFCTSCGSSSLTIPSSDSKSGIWFQSTEKEKERINYEFEFAQCTKCNKIYWNTKKIEK